MFKDIFSRSLSEWLSSFPYLVRPFQTGGWVFGSMKEELWFLVMKETDQQLSFQVIKSSFFPLVERILEYTPQNVVLRHCFLISKMIWFFFTDSKSTPSDYVSGDGENPTTCVPVRSPDISTGEDIGYYQVQIWLNNYGTQL